MSSQAALPASTRTVKVHWAWFPDVSVAVQMTVVAPSGKGEPEGGTQTTLARPQLSFAMGDGKVTTAPDPPVQNEPEDTVLSAGQVIVGGSVSFTVTVCWQVVEFPEVSVTLQVTIVTPLGNTAGALFTTLPTPQL